jgi:hypothetical protein
VPVGREIGQAGDTRQSAGTDPARFREHVMKTNTERDHAIKKLSELVPHGATIYVLLRHKNSLGTCRWLEFYVICDNDLKRITWDVTQAIDGTYCREHDATQVTGAGLDVGYASVDTLSQVLFGTGRALMHKWL